MDLRRFFAFVWRWAWLLLAGSILAGAAAFTVSSVTTGTPRFQSTAILLVGPALTAADANPAQLEASQRVSTIYAEVATSRPVLQRVIDEIPLETDVELLRAQLTVSTPEEPPIITVTAEADNPDLAAALANEVVQQLIAVSPALATEADQTAQFIESQLLALEEEIQTLVNRVETLASEENRTPEQDEELAIIQDRLANLRGTYAALVSASTSTSSTLLTVIESAVPNTEPVPRGRLQLTLFAAVVGLVLAAGVGAAMDQLDETINSDDDINSAGGFDTLAEIPSIRRQLRRNPANLVVQLGRHPGISESFHSLRTGIELSAGKTVHNLVVTSGLRGEGKTTVTALLGVAFAQAGRRVLLVDADVRRPALHEWFGLDNKHGLTDLLASPHLEIRQHTQPTAIPNLNLLAAGSPPPIDPAGIVGSSRMTKLLARLGKQVDLLVIDSPSLLVAAEGGVLAASAEWTLVVVASGRTSVATVRETSVALRRSQARVIGAALNRVPTSRASERSNAYPVMARRAEVSTPQTEDEAGL